MFDLRAPLPVAEPALEVLPHTGAAELHGPSDFCPGEVQIDEKLLEVVLVHRYVAAWCEKKPSTKVSVKSSARKGLSDENITASVFLWPRAVDYLKVLIEDEEMSMTQIASELGMTHSALSRILSGKTARPHARTRFAIVEWATQHARSNAPPDRADENVDAVPQRQIKSPDQDLLGYFLEHHQQMATLMARSSEGLSPEDRRKVALALLNAFKRMAIEAGEKIPPFLFDLERKFVEE